MSKIFSTLFDNFRAAPVFRPLLGGSDLVWFAGATPGKNVISTGSATPALLRAGGCRPCLALAGPDALRAWRGQDGPHREGGVLLSGETFCTSPPPLPPVLVKFSVLPFP